MSYVYGTLRTYITGTSDELALVSDVLQVCEHGEDFKDWFMKDWASAVKSPKKATHGRQTVTVPYETAAAELLVVGDVPAVYAFGGEVREIQGNDK